MAEGFDPFADSGEAPETETPQDPAPKKTTTRTRKTATKKEAPVAEGTETKTSKLSVTLKGGAGFDAPWVVLYPDTLDEAKELLGEENREALKEILEGAQKAASYFIGAAPAKAPQNAAGGSNGGGRGGYSGGRGNAPQGAKEHPKGKTAFCEHGARQYKTGTVKSGKNAGNVWHAFDCPNGVCDREWDNG